MDFEFRTGKAGTYRTSVFRVSFEFTQTTDFGTFGEGSDIVNLDAVGCVSSGRCQSVVLAWIGEDSVDLGRLADDECASSEEGVQESMVLGLPALILDAEYSCNVVLGEFGGVPYGGEEGARFIFYSVTVGGGIHLLIGVDSTPVEEFGDYFANVAKPLINSIVFLDE